MNACRVWTIALVAADRPLFPPLVVVEVKALACEHAKEHGLPLSRLSTADIAAEAVRQGLVASISGITVWRWLSADAIKPWSFRSWISPRAPDFEEKATRVLDLYHGMWDGKPLTPNDFVLCADEKTSIQARYHSTDREPEPRRYRRVESDYERRGALAYIAAWDVRQAKVLGRCEETTGIEPFHGLVDLVMTQEPYRSADRVFWITDNGSSHRGQTSIERLSQWYGNAVLVHTPVHASWLNQVEIYFSLVQRKVLTPNNFTSTAELEDHLLRFQTYYGTTAKPFQWRFTKDDLRRLLDKLAQQQAMLEPPA